MIRFQFIITGGFGICITCNTVMPKRLCGHFESQLEFDNLPLEGDVPLLVDDFEDGNTETLIGGQLWAGGGDGAATGGISRVIHKGLLVLQP